MSTTASVPLPVKHIYAEEEYDCIPLAILLFMKQCVHCQSYFNGKTAWHPTSRCCSRKCSDSLKRNCAHCDKWFSRNNGNQLEHYCSWKCASAAHQPNVVSCPLFCKWQQFQKKLPVKRKTIVTFFDFMMWILEKPAIQLLELAIRCADSAKEERPNNETEHSSKSGNFVSQVLIPYLQYAENQHQKMHADNSNKNEFSADYAHAIPLYWKWEVWGEWSMAESMWNLIYFVNEISQRMGPYHFAYLNEQDNIESSKLVAYSSQFVWMNAPFSENEKKQLTERARNQFNRAWSNWLQIELQYLHNPDFCRRSIYHSIQLSAGSIIHPLIEYIVDYVLLPE